MGKKRAADPPLSEAEVQEPEVVEEGGGNGAPEGEPAPEPAEEATAAVTFRGKASAVQKAADRFGARRTPQPAQTQEEEEEDDTYSDACGELMADGRNKLIVTRVRPKKYEGLKVRPIRGEYDCPTTKAELEGMVFEDFGGERFRVAIYPDTATAESKPPLGAFNITNHETDQPWEPEDENVAPADGRPASGDPYSKEDRSPGGTAKRVLAEEAEHLESEINVKRLRKTLKQVDGEDDDKPPARDPSEDRVRLLEDRITIRDVESRMDKKLDAVLETIKESRQPKGEGKDVFVAMIQSMQAQTTAMLTAMQSNQATVIAAITSSNKKSDDGFESLEKIARLKSLFGGDSDRINELMTLAVERMLDGGDKGKDDADESDVKYAINKLEPSFNRFVESMIEDKKKRGEPVTREELEAIKLEAARKAAKEMEADLVKRGYIIKLPPEGAPPLPAPKPPLPLGTPPLNPKERDMNLPPAPSQREYDRRKAVDFVLDVAIDDIKKGMPETSYLPWDIADSLDQELLDEFSKVETGFQLDELLSKWGDSERIAQIKELGKNELVKSWLSRVVATAKDYIIKRKAGVLK